MEPVSKPLFESPAQEGPFGPGAGANGAVAIVLVDCSGSVQTVLNNGSGKMIFDKFGDIVQTLPFDNFRLIFWSSNNHKQGQFANGVMRIPFVVKKESVASTFALCRPNIGGSTQPNIGFQAIPQEWLVNDPIIYFLTDGQFDPNIRSEFSRQIEQVQARLVIISVENVHRDMNKLEVVAQSAGADVFKLIQENNLTRRVMRFVSHSLSGEFVQFSRIIAPPGFIPFGEVYFSETRIYDFVQHVRQLLQEGNNAGEAKQLEIAQKLSITLEQITKDKPQKVADDILRTFSSLFTLDKNLVQYILSDAVNRERQGKAVVFANYRAQLKDLFQQAEGLLKQGVFSSIGHSDQFVSHIIDNHILVGSYRLIDKTIAANGGNYPSGGYTPHLPVFPLLSSNSQLSELNEQCLRQWTRAVYATIYGTNVMSDEIIYLVMGNMLRIARSPAVADEVKEAYRKLVRVMLNKKRANSMTTEYDRLASGDAPLPNSGKIEELHLLLRTVATKLNITTPASGPMGPAGAMALFYEMCLAFDPDIAAKQKKHCYNDAATSGGGVEQILLNSPPLSVDHVPDTLTLDYSCLVTLDDISAVGGYRILPHQGPAGLCSPIYVFSQEGKQSMLAAAPQNCACPVCYQPITAVNFEAIGPKTEFVLPESYSSLAEKFTAKPAEVHHHSSGSGSGSNKPGRSYGGNNNNNNNNNNQGGKALVLSNANGKKGIVVVLKGTVGAGKSTAAEKIKSLVEGRGGVCYIEGTDKYCKMGMQTRDAVQRVKEGLASIAKEPNDDVVVVIDTCGENTPTKEYTIFGTNFTGWKKVEILVNLDKDNMKGYYAWSLRNVLLRGLPQPDSTHYLNPVSAGAETCISVHKKKCKTLFQKNMKDWNFDHATVATLTPLAEEYEKQSLPKFQLPNL